MLTTQKDVEKSEPTGAPQPGFMTYEQAELQMKHGHSVRRASWSVDVHMTDGKMIGVEPLVEEDDPNHDPADSNPDETRKARRYAELISGKEPKKREAKPRTEKKMEKDDKQGNDWTFYKPGPLAS